MGDHHIRPRQTSSLIITDLNEAVVVSHSATQRQQKKFSPFQIVICDIKEIKSWNRSQLFWHCDRSVLRSNARKALIRTLAFQIINGSNTFAFNIPLITFQTLRDKKWKKRDKDKGERSIL